MASISTDKRGNRTIQFVAGDRLRRSIRLGKLPIKVANTIKARVEALNAAAIAKISIDRETAEWVGRLDATLHGKLAAVGLVPKREEITLAAFLDAYRAERGDLKPSTRTNHRQAADNLLACFGPSKPIRSFSTDSTDGDRFRRFLVGLGLGENTIRKRCQIAKLFFKHAKRRKLLAENPFLELVGAVRSDRAKFYFVSTDEAERVIEACPDAQWRLLFALSRYGGLRCPSEHLALKWSDIDWAENRMTVRSPKTEHIQGHEWRTVPIFRELRAHLEAAAWDQAPEGAEFVIATNRRAGVNWRTQLQRIMAKSGVKPWPRLFHNLRATRQTELTNQFPAHVVCQWLGNSQATANESYLRVTDEHFQAAVSTSTSAPGKALHNPVQSAAVSTRSDSQTTNTPNEQTPVLPGLAASCDYLPNCPVLPDGLEPSTL